MTNYEKRGINLRVRSQNGYFLNNTPWGEHHLMVKPVKTNRGEPHSTVVAHLRDAVRTMAERGSHPTTIAATLKLPLAFLKKNFAAELAQGQAEAVSKVEGMMMDMIATGEFPQLTRYFLEANGPKKYRGEFDDDSEQPMKRLVIR